MDTSIFTLTRQQVVFDGTAGSVRALATAMVTLRGTNG